MAEVGVMETLTKQKSAREIPEMKVRGVFAGTAGVNIVTWFVNTYRAAERQYLSARLLHLHKKHLGDFTERNAKQLRDWLKLPERFEITQLGKDGLGAGGEIEVGEQAVAPVKDALLRDFRKSDLTFGVTAFAGASGPAVMNAVFPNEDQPGDGPTRQVTTKRGFIAAIMPFGMENKGSYAVGEWRKLRRKAVVVFTFFNELLLATATPTEHPKETLWRMNDEVIKPLITMIDEMIYGVGEHLVDLRDFLRFLRQGKWGYFGFERITGNPAPEEIAARALALRYQARPAGLEPLVLIHFFGEYWTLQKMNSVIAAMYRRFEEWNIAERPTVKFGHTRSPNKSAKDVSWIGVVLASNEEPSVEESDCTPSFQADAAVIPARNWWREFWSRVRHPSGRVPPVSSPSVEEPAEANGIILPRREALAEPAAQTGMPLEPADGRTSRPATELLRPDLRSHPANGSERTSLTAESNAHPETAAAETQATLSVPANSSSLHKTFRVKCGGKLVEIWLADTDYEWWRLLHNRKLADIPLADRAKLADKIASFQVRVSTRNNGNVPDAPPWFPVLVGKPANNTPPAPGRLASLANRLTGYGQTRQIRIGGLDERQIGEITDKQRRNGA